MLVKIFFLTLIYLVCSEDYPVNVRIGIFRGIFSRDGILDYVGTLNLGAIFMAINDINKSRTLLSKTKLEFALRGTNHGEYRAAAKTSQDFIDVVFGGTGVKLVVGTGFFDSSRAASQVFSYVGINNIDFGAINTELSHADTYPFFKRVCPSDSFDAVILASVAQDLYGFDRLNVIHTLDTYGTDASSQFAQEARRRKINIENNLSFWPQETDFENIFDELQSNGINKVFVLLMKSQDAGRLLEAMFNKGLLTDNTQVLGTQYVMMPATWRSMSKDAPVSMIMNGVVGVQPYVNRSSPVFLDFLQRYLKQPDTKIYDKDGSVKCSSRKDDDGNTFLFNQTGSSGCGGVAYSALAADGSQVPDSVAYAYDSVMTVAHALHQLMYVRGRSNFTGVEMSDALLRDVEFRGATGQVSLFAGYGGKDGFAVGDRQSDLSYRILNFNPNFYHKNEKDQTKAVRTIGLWTTADRTGKSPAYDHFQACDVDNDETCTKPVYRTTDGSPVDGSPAVVQVDLGVAGKIYLRVGAALCCLTIVWYGLVVYLFWDTRIVKLSQPVVMVIVLFGGSLGTIQIVLKTLQVTENVCVTSMWIGHCAFAVIFLTLLFKTWRISAVVNSGFTRIKFTNQKMYQILTFFLSLFCFILLVDTLVGQPHPSIEDIFDGREIIRRVSCKTRNPSISFSLFAMEAAILFYGARLSYSAKDAPKTVNDSTEVSLSIYLILFVCAVAFPIVFLSIKPTPENLDIVMATGFIVAVLGVVNILFAHRTYLILDGADIDQNFNLVRSEQSSSSKGKLSNMANRFTDKVGSKIGRGTSNRADESELALAKYSQGKDVSVVKDTPAVSGLSRGGSQFNHTRASRSGKHLTRQQSLGSVREFSGADPSVVAEEEKKVSPVEDGVFVI